MSATVQTRVVDLDELIPRVVSQDLEGISLPTSFSLHYHNII